MKVGDRVKTNIQDFDHYAVGCADCLNNKTGIVEKYIVAGVFDDQDRVLIRFDTPARTWIDYQIPWETAWIPVNDVQEVPSC
jgi:hypothetical protein